MAYAAIDLNPFEDDLVVLTDEIFSEIGNRDRLVDEKARAEAIARVERILARAMRRPSEPDPRLDVHDCEGDIAFGRQDAEYAFEERLGRA